MDDKPAAGIARTDRSRPAQWIIAISLACIAVCMVLRLDERLLPAATAEPVAQAGARGVFAFSGQLCNDSYGIFMVDVDAMTIWGYEYLCGSKKLRLVGNRSWMYDRYLEDNNFEGPTPEQVKQLVEQEREAKLRNR
jgi:hypothetical protein